MKPMARSLFLLDGENLVARYEAMRRDGKRPTEGVKHIERVFVWHQNITAYAEKNGIVRVAFYTSLVGDDGLIDRYKMEISNTYYTGSAHGRKICPVIFKKPSKSQKNKNVDIAITIDALRHAFQDHIDELFLFSGDGDYLPLIKEVMRAGKRVFLGAFSSGLKDELRWSVDSFIDLDEAFFHKD